MTDLCRLVQPVKALQKLVINDIKSLQITET